MTQPALATQPDTTGTERAEFVAYAQQALAKLWAMTDPGTPRWGRREKLIVRSILKGEL